MRRPNSHVRYLMLCAAGATLCSHALAAEWQVVPSANIGTSYADNPRLLSDGGTSSEGAVGEINATFKRLTERTELSLRPRLNSARYSDDASLSSDNQYLTTGYRWVGERSEWNSEVAFTRDTTLTSELGLTGLTQTNRRHEATSLSVAPTVMLTERVSGGVQMYLLNNRYPDPGFTGLVDYRYTALSLFSSVTLSDVGSTLTVTAQGGELTSDAPATRDGTLRLAWKYQPWLLWTVALSAGPSMVKTDAGSDTGVVFDAEIKRQDERWSLVTTAGRSQSPTGRGVLTRRDQVTLKLSRSITERFSASVGAHWIRSEDLLPQQGIATYQVDYGRLDLTGNWRMSRDWSLSLQLSGNTQDYELAPERADGYRASLSMVWNGQPHSL